MNAVQALRRTMDAITKIATSLPGVFILEPRVFGDERGFFFESYNYKVMAEVGISERFVQDNHSSSRRNVLRGLHYQVKQPQGKLVRVADGEILDVAVDLRASSPTYGKWFSIELSAKNKTLLYVPVGFAHGFATLSDYCEVQYKQTDFYQPEAEGGLAWNDPHIGIQWPYANPILSKKDLHQMSFRQYRTNPSFR